MSMLKPYYHLNGTTRITAFTLSRPNVETCNLTIHKMNKM